MTDEHKELGAKELALRGRKWRKDIEHIKNFHQLSSLLLELDNIHTLYSGFVERCQGDLWLDLKKRVDALELKLSENSIE